jgi:hypothetical protein
VKNRDVEAINDWHSGRMANQFKPEIAAPDKVDEPVV